MCPGMIPSIALPGLITPAQLGPISRVRRAALPRGHAADDVGAVGDHLVRVERALVAREALDDDGGLFIEQDAHTGPGALALEVLTPCPPLPAGEGGLWTFPLSGTERGSGGEDRRAPTTRSAASARVPAVMIGSPLSFRMRRPSSTFVPASRTTRGTGTWTARTACTTPCATQSQRLMPANTLTSIARTFLSESTRRNAAATRSGEAPPPISRKLAGSPPACLIMSIVAIASPAPLMMQPMSPSRAT